jgi:hypothetical protein
VRRLRLLAFFGRGSVDVASNEELGVALVRFEVCELVTSVRFEVCESVSGGSKSISVALELVDWLVLAKPSFDCLLGAMLWCNLSMVKPDTYQQRPYCAVVDRRSHCSPAASALPSRVFLAASRGSAAKGLALVPAQIGSLGRVQVQV